MANIDRFTSQWKSKFRLAIVAFTLIFVVISAVVWREIPNETRQVFLVFSTLLFIAIIGISLFFRSYLERTLIRPLIGLTRDVQTQSIIGSPIVASEYDETMLASLVPAFSKNEKLDKQIESSEGRLAEVIHMIDQAIIITDIHHRVVLVNARAREMFSNQNTLGLGRQLNQTIDIEPIEAAINRISKNDTTYSERIFITVNHVGVVPARVTMLRGDDGQALAHVIGLNYQTNTLFRMSNLEREYENLLLVSRSFVAHAHFSSFNHNDEGLKLASEGFSHELHLSRDRSQKMIGNAWPKARVSLLAFARLLEERLKNTTINDPPYDIILRADVASLLTVLEMLTEGIHKNQHSQITIRFKVDQKAVKVIVQTSAQVDVSLIENLMKTALTEIPTAPTANEILKFHGTEIWPHLDDAENALVFILPRITTELLSNAARPEYYEFELPAYTENFTDTLLRDLSIVVFDSETTGLDPKGGDKVIQLSAVRVLRGKVIGGEIFDRLVNPERNIPTASTEIHKITNDMVHDAAVIYDVLHEFSDFSNGDVLLAHNAAFDMAFIGAGAQYANLVFDQPVLDTVYMSAFLFDHTGKHTLDDLSKRLGVEIPKHARHTALGDAIATAQVFVRLIPLLEERGVNTLGQMLEIGAQMHKIRKAQAVYR